MEPQQKRIGAARARGVHAHHGTAERDRQGTVPARVQGKNNGGEFGAAARSAWSGGRWL
jgi:hypothetical protein